MSDQLATLASEIEAKHTRVTPPVDARQTEHCSACANAHDTIGDGYGIGLSGHWEPGDWPCDAIRAARLLRESAEREDAQQGELQRALREREELRTTIAELRRVALHVADELWRETSLSLKGDGGAIAMIEAAAASAGADSLASAYARGFEAAREQAAKRCEQLAESHRRIESRVDDFIADECAAAIRALKRSSA